MKKSFGLIFVIFLVVGIGCKGKQQKNIKPVEETPPPATQVNVPQPHPQVSAQQQPQQAQQQVPQQPQPFDLTPFYRQFAGNLYARIAASQEGENFVFSPLAAFQELGMLYAGADGKTKENIQRLFGTQQLKGSDMGVMFKQRTANQNATRSYSALWIQKDYPVIKQFVSDRLEQGLGSNVYSVDFLEAREESLRLINAWSSDMTGGNVPLVLSDYPDQTRLLLTNILMHRVDWQQPFDMSKTSDQEFTSLEGEKITKSMMHKTDQFACYHQPDLQMLILRYLQPDYRLVIFVPQAEQFAEFEKIMAAQQLQNYFNHVQSVKMTLGIPRLEMENAMDLRPFFTKTFENPNLKGMSQSDLEPLTIGPIIQKTLFKMNESGSSEIPPPQEPPVAPSEGVPAFAVDRPFIFLVWHAQSMTPIIMGRVVK